MYLEIEQYEQNLLKLVDFVNNGPYKLDYILEKLNISRTTFYNKRKTNNFTLSEVKVLAKLYDDVDATSRLEEQINLGLEDIENGRYMDFDLFLKETKAKYGL